MRPRKASVLLMAYGAAASLEEIPAYLQDILEGRPASPELVAEVRQRYRLMGGRSPLLEITRAQAKALEERLNAEEGPGAYVVHVGMWHSAPTILEAVQRMKQERHTYAVAMALTPYYSKLSVEAYLKRYREAVEDCGGGFTTLAVESWCRHPSYVEAWAAKVRAGLSRFSDGERARVQVLFTAHSLPARILNDGDPYPGELLHTAEAVARQAGLSSCEFAYQSRGRTPEPWLGPEAGEVIGQLAADGCRHLLLIPIGFLSDHMETLYDDDVLYRRQAEGLGMRYERAESLNCDPMLIRALADVVRNRVAAAEHPVGG